MALTWEYIADLSGTKGDIGTYYQRELTAGDNIFTLGPGVYRAGFAALSNANLPIGRYGDLIVHSAGGGRTITFQTNDLGIVRNEIRVFVIGSDNAGSFAASKWRELTSLARGLPSNHAIDTWSKEPGYNGTYAASVSSVNAVKSTNPTNFNYSLDHETQPNGGTRQVAYATHAGDQGMYHRAETATASGELTPWKRIMDEKMSPTLNRSELLFQEMAAAHGGRVYTGDAVPVALTFDDYPRDFRDRILPLLRARGLPCTIGLSSRMYDEASTVIHAGATGTTWAEINAWPASVSIANHSATHGPATDRFSIYSEIVLGLKELRAAVPNKPICTFMQPSVAYDEGFDNGSSAEAYASTIAGHLQLGHHAYVTGTRRVDTGTTCPMIGNRPVQGMTRNWLDNKAGIDLARTRILGAGAIKHGLILAAHADRFGKAGYATLADFTVFLDWLKAEQDAGRIRVLKLEEFAIAQYGSAASTEEILAQAGTLVDESADRLREQVSAAAEVARKYTDNELEDRMPEVDSQGLLAVVTDAAGRHTFMAARDSDGAPTRHAAGLIADSIGVNDHVAGEYLHVFTDSAGRASDLATRSSDGQLANFVVKRLAPRIAAEVGFSGNPTERWVHPSGDLVLMNVDSSKWSAWGSSGIERMAAEMAGAASRIGAPYYNGGQGGERFWHTEARLGSAPALLTFPDNLIPGTIADVDVTASNVPPSSAMRFFTGTIAGVHGTLKSSDATLRFGRTAGGAPMQVKPGTPFIPAYGSQYRASPAVIQPGKNNITLEGDSGPSVIESTHRMFNWFAPMAKRVLVLGHHANGDWTANSTTLWNRLAEVNGALEERYGPQYLDLQRWLTSAQIWTQLGITPTQADRDAQTLGALAPSLRADDLHLTTEVNQLLAARIEQRFKDLNWF